jgi:hypothetical protein
VRALFWVTGTPQGQSRLSAQTILGLRLTWRTAPSDHKKGPERLSQCFAQERSNPTYAYLLFRLKGICHKGFETSHRPVFGHGYPSPNQDNAL